MSDDGAHLAPAPSRSPIEQKVTAATGGATAGVVIAGAIDWALEDYVFHGPVPDRLESLIFLAVSAGLTFLAGYLAPHTNRTIGS